MRDKGQDEPLVTAFRAGEEWAFAKVFERYRRPMLKFVSQRLDNPDDAPDLVQEIFIKAYRFRESYDLGYRFSTWLWTIARNTSVDWSRRRMAPQSEIPADVASNGPSSEDLLDRKLNRRMLRRWLRSLTAHQRRAVWLRVMHQLSYEEISIRLGLSVSAVKCLVYRARTTLRRFGVSFAFA